MAETRKTRTPRTGRRPGASGSRAAIIEAARRLFAERGYSATSMRAIGAEAGVDAALIVHFFGTKARLLRESIRWPFVPEEAAEQVYGGGRRNVGENLARLVLDTWEHEGDRNAIMTLLRGATVEPEAADMLREFMQNELFPPLFERLEVPEAQLRANLTASQLVGLGMARYVLRLEPLASMDSEAVVAWIAPTLQRYLAGRAPA
jgi:AcrR family transcriptional regulator